MADEVDPKSYCFRLFVHMETGDTRYLHLNTGMWVGSGVRRGTEGMSSFYAVSLSPGGFYWGNGADVDAAVIYDAYRVT